MVQNIENIIKGFSNAAKTSDDLKLNIIGDGSELNHLKDFVEQEGIPGVYFLGRRPLKEMQKWLFGSDVLLISLINKPIFALTVPAKFQA